MLKKNIVAGVVVAGLLSASQMQALDKDLKSLLVAGAAVQLCRLVQPRLDAIGNGLKARTPSFVLSLLGRADASEAKPAQAHATPAASSAHPVVAAANLAATQAAKPAAAACAAATAKCTDAAHPAAAHTHAAK